MYLLYIYYKIFLVNLFYFKTYIFRIVEVYKNASLLVYGLDAVYIEVEIKEAIS